MAHPADVSIRNHDTLSALVSPPHAAFKRTVTLARCSARGGGGRKNGAVTVVSCEATTRPFGTRLCSLTRYAVAPSTGIQLIWACLSAMTAAVPRSCRGDSHIPRTTGEQAVSPIATTALDRLMARLDRKSHGQGTRENHG